MGCCGARGECPIFRNIPRKGSCGMRKSDLQNWCEDLVPRGSFQWWANSTHGVLNIGQYQSQNPESAVMRDSMVFEQIVQTGSGEAG